MAQTEQLVKHQFSPSIKAQLAPLKQKNNWYNWFAILLDWGIIASLIAINQLYGSILIYLVSIIIIGGRMRGLDNLMHDASHYMLFRNKSLNRWAACFLIGFPVFTAFTSYRISHYQHHKFLWTEKDPDTSRLKKMGLANRVEQSKLSFLIHYILKPFLLHQIFSSLGSAIKTLLIPGEQNKYEYSWKLLFWAVLIGGSIRYDFWLELILYYFIPLFTVFQIIRLWSDVADHSGLESGSELFASRNSYGSLLERFILYPHHDSYHIVHHLFPNIPHYNLHKTHLILLNDPEYRRAHHCAGTFSNLIPGVPSVIHDISAQEQPLVTIIGKE